MTREVHYDAIVLWEWREKLIIMQCDVGMAREVHYDAIVLWEW